ncbi:putative papain-like cysteine peptidase superfamily [Helianthus anomalus]
MKYGIKSLIYYDTPHKIRQALLRNFGNEGPKYPIIAGCEMYDFPSISARKATAKNPFQRKYPMKNDDDPRHHCVVITGIYVASPVTHKIAVQIKNSHGYGWGNAGKSWVTEDFFRVIGVPKMAN